MRARVPVMFWRALRLRCPHCGGGPIFLSWFRLMPACPRCGLTLERGERGYWLGAYFVGLVAIETVFCAWWVAVMWYSWPDIPWTFLHLSTIALLLLTAVGFYPASHTVFLAFDLLVHPAEPEDFSAPVEPAPRQRAR